jgi:putative IMPACT (imprinted ancient) family translation regulator
VGYRTIAETSEATLLVKGSRFLAVVAPIASESDIAAWIARLRAREPDAHHVAWAARLADAMRFSDDGEPGGTAGRPILEILLKRDLDRCIALVARHFGGVKLGAGGLVRAYGGAAARALDAATISEVLDRSSFVLRAPFADCDALLRALATPGVVHAPPTFASDGFSIEGSVLATATEAFEQRIRDVSRGRASLRWGEAQRK